MATKECRSCGFPVEVGSIHFPEDCLSAALHEIKMLKEDGRGSARQIHGQEEKIRQLELQVEVYRSALEDIRGIDPTPVTRGIIVAAGEALEKGESIRASNGP